MGRSVEAIERGNLIRDGNNFREGCKDHKSNKQTIARYGRVLPGAFQVRES